MMLSRFLSGALTCTVLFGILGAAARAQEGETVVGVEIRGKARVSTERILDNLKTRPGAVFSEETLSEDIKRLYENKDFRILAVRREVVKVPGGVKVVIYVKQDDRIRGIAFRGVVKEDEKDLRDLIGLTEETVVSPYVLTSYADMIRRYYRGKGYYLAEVNVWVEPSKKGREAVFEVFEGDKVTVDEIRFLGLKKLEAGELEKRMKTSTPTLWIFTSDLKEDVLKKDVVRLNEYARGEGYLDAKISLEDVILNDDRDGASIVFRVQEGERYKVGSIDLRFGEWKNGTCRNPVSSSEFSKEEILGLVETKRGDFYRAVRVRRDVRRIEEFYGERGYIRAKVADVAEDYDPEKPVVNLTFWVAEDRKKTVRDVIVAGNTRTRDKVIRREITLYPGDVFKKSEMDWSKNQLNSLQFFVNEKGQPRVYTEHRETSDPAKEDYYVEVEEGKTGFFFFTLGASTDGGIFGGGRIQKRNFDLFDPPSSFWTAPLALFTNDAFHGGGQTLTLSAMPGTIFSSYELDFYEPYFLGVPPRPISLDFNVYHRSTDYTDYDVARTGIAPSIGKRLNRFWSVNLTLRNEQIKMTNVTQSAPLEAKEMEGATGRRSVEISARHRSVDNPYDPKKGFSNGIAYEYTGGVLGNDLEMNRFYLDSTWRVPVLETAGGAVHQIVLRGTAGWEHEQGGMDDVPIFERFFVGGSSGRFPLRGFKWREVGPREQGEAVGGKFAYALSAEYVVPLYSYYDSYYDTETTIFRGVFFVDAGSVAEDIHASGEIRQLRSSYGVGLRITLPVFAGLPIALDYGIPYKDYPGDERRSFSFNIQKMF